MPGYLAEGTVLVQDGSFAENMGVYDIICKRDLGYGLGVYYFQQYRGNVRLI
jgi:hypothetical protein